MKGIFEVSSVLSMTVEVKIVPRSRWENLFPVEFSLDLRRPLQSQGAVRQ